MATASEKLAESLEVLHKLQNANGAAAIRARDLSRTHRERNPCNPRRSNWRSDPAAGDLYEHLLKLRAAVAPNLEGFEDGLTSLSTDTLDEQPI